MQAGTAWVDITPDRPLPLQGQMHERIPERTRDPLTANAIALRDGDEAPVVIVSCDLCAIADEFVRRVQADAAQQHDIAAERILLAATHTHVGPAMLDFRGEADPQYLDWLHGRLVQLIGQSIKDMEHVQMFAAQGYCEHMGWNRRGLHKDGQVDMYFGSWNEDFAGVEGPRDGQVPVIWARRDDGSVKAVITGFATHPNCCEGERFYSADMVGATRRNLRAVLGQDVGVVYLTGCAGNTAPTQLENNPDKQLPWRGEAGLERSGTYLAAEVIKTMMAAIEPMQDQQLALHSQVLHIPMREWPKDFDPQTLRAGGLRDYYTNSRANWAQHMKQQSPCPVHVHALRIGDAVICTNPAELYVEHGLAVKATSPARMTMMAQLTDGYCGYVPTMGAFTRGGYSTWTAPTSKLERDAGDRMVAATRALLSQAFSDAAASQKKTASTTSP